MCLLLVCYVLTSDQKVLVCYVRTTVMCLRLLLVCAYLLLVCYVLTTDQKVLVCYMLTTDQKVLVCYVLTTDQKVLVCYVLTNDQKYLYVSKQAGASCCCCNNNLAQDNKLLNVYRCTYSINSILTQRGGHFFVASPAPRYWGPDHEWGARKFNSKFYLVN